MNGIITKNELREKIDNLRLYLNNDTIFYLNSLLNLEVSVFKQEKYNEVLHKLDIFMDLAYYNICLRSLKIINELGINHKNITCGDEENYFDISYKLDQEIDFLIVNKGLAPMKKCLVNICSPINIDIEVEKLQKKISKNSKSKLFCLGSSMSFSDIQYKEIILQEEINFLQANKEEIEELSKKISTSLISDFGISQDEFQKQEKDNKVLVRSLSWCDIYKNNNF